MCGIYCAFNGNMTVSVFLLMFSGLCDMFDGKIARTKKDRTEDEKSFGIQIDSLCDIVCFGVLPACILFALDGIAMWQAVLGALFVLCGLIRLAYFNVMEEARQRTTTENRKSYVGLPITSSAVLIPLVMCFSKQLGSSLPHVYTGALVLLSVLYICPFRIKKPGKAGGVLLLIAGVCIFELFLYLTK